MNWTESTRTISYNDYLVLRDELNNAQQIIKDYADEIEELNMMVSHHKGSAKGWREAYDKLKALCRGFGIEVK